jgi:hypothetical protein
MRSFTLFIQRLKQTPRILQLALLAGVITLVLGYFLKAPCLSQPWGGSARIEYTHLCYNDLQPLYGSRHLRERKIPYIEETRFEYPVLIGLEMYVASLVSSNHVEFFYANLPFLALSALLAIAALTLALAPEHRRRVFWFAASPVLIQYAFINWDLFAVVFFALGFLAWTRGHLRACGLALGSGAAAKIFPGFAVPALMLASFHRTRAFREPVRIAIYSALGWALWNVPVMLATLIANGDISGWIETYRFHSRRLPDFGTVWFWWAEDVIRSPGLALGAIATVLALAAYALRDLWKADRRWSMGLGAGLALLCVVLLFVPSAAHGPRSPEWKELVDRVSFLFFALGTAGILYRQWKRSIDPACTAGAVVALFLMVSKVHSPQYALWILPFLVLTNLPWTLVACHLVADVVLHASGFWWFAASPNLAPHFWQVLFAVSVYVREAVLLLMVSWWMLKGRDLVAFVPRVGGDRPVAAPSGW